MLKERYPYYLANRAEQPNADLEVTNKYTGEVATRVAMADKVALDRAIAAAAEAAPAMARMAAWQRKGVLQHLAKRVRERHEEMAQGLTIEAGKPIKYARGEVDRLLDTIDIAAEESTRMYGEVLPLDISQRADGYRGMWKRVPVGPCSFITPWNFPLNLVAHKLAPALACGCPFVLKPATTTPIGAIILGEILAETDLPLGAFSILPMDTKNADALVEDTRLKKLSFTGSPGVGWTLRDRAKKKHVTLELGGNAATIIDRDADIEDAVARNIFGGYYQSGQSCISVQRILVHEAVYAAFRDKFVPAVKALKMGDPALEDTFIGPIISDKEAERIEQMIQQAVKGGGKLLCGGKRDGRMVEPAVLENVPIKADAWCEEIFGPVTVLHSFREFDDAIRMVNNSHYGLQCGIFTRDLFHAERAWDEIEAGGVLINEVPSWRVDHMPYGGVKDSGLGREGIRWAMDSMTEPRLMVIRMRK